MAKAKQQQEESKELKGIDFEIHLVDGQVVLTVSHVGADAQAELKLNLDAAKFYGMAIDKIEDLIPGDQKAIAKGFKAMLDGIEF